MTVFRILLCNHEVCRTNSHHVAQAAWHRVTRDRQATQHGGIAELWVDAVRMAAVTPETGKGSPWPLSYPAPLDWHDVVKALLLLLRGDGWDAKAIASAMTEFGLPTTRSRIDALRGAGPDRMAEVSPAELVVLLRAVLGSYNEPD